MQQEYGTVIPRKRTKKGAIKKVVSFFARLFKAIVAVAKMVKKVILRRKEEAKFAN